MRALLTATDLAPFFDRSPLTINRWMREGRLRTVPLSHHQSRYVALAELDRLTGQSHVYTGPERLSQRHAAAWMGLSADTVHRAVALGFVPVDGHGAVDGVFVRALIEGAAQ